MFTGIIQAVGHISAILPQDNEAIITVDATGLDLNDVQIGDSIAVNGVCLTAVSLNNTQFTAHVSAETMRVTTALNHHNPVNLEKALRLSDRLGGHLVSGHVDGVGIVTEFVDLGASWRLVIAAPHMISKYIAVKGSICVNGVSLTVNTVESDLFSINIIPHTFEKTTFGTLQVHDKVNLEIDQIARYVERMTEWQTQS